jgi:uncharacterized protein
VSEVFADTFFFIALLSPSDAAHEAAVDAARREVRTLVTTDWVLTELADGLSAPAQRGGCEKFVTELLQESDVVVVPASRELLEKGLALYRQRPDKEWSLTDCISFVVMGERQLRDALTGDRHFEQAGFKPLLEVKR